MRNTGIPPLPKAHIIPSRHSGESRNPGTSTTLDPGFRRGDVKGFTKTIKKRLNETSVLNELLGAVASLFRLLQYFLNLRPVVSYSPELY